eukprot:5901188-Pyramimonas_sp.AAC.1
MLLLHCAGTRSADALPVHVAPAQASAPSLPLLSSLRLAFLVLALALALAAVHGLVRLLVCCGLRNRLAGEPAFLVTAASRRRASRSNIRASLLL